MEIPYQLVLEAGRRGARCAAEGVPDISTALHADCEGIARDIDLPNDLSPDALGSVAAMPLRPAELNVVEYGDRVRAIVKSLLAPELARLQAEADTLWTDARATYAERMARVRASEGVRGPIR